MQSVMLAGALSAVFLVGSVAGRGAEANENPYQDISRRNAFALKPPPPPPDPSEANQPPPSSIEVFLTGISTLGGTKKVLLQIVEKGPNKKPDLPPPLVEGDVEGRVEVVAIDPAKGAVQIKIDGSERTLTFEKDAPKPANVAVAPPPGLPAGHGLAGLNPLLAATAPAAAGAGSHSVMVGGAAASAPVTAAASPAGAQALATGLGAAGMPARPMRTATDGAAGLYLGGSGVAVGGAGSATAAAATSAGSSQTVPDRTIGQVYAHIEEQRRLIAEAEGLGMIPKGKFPPLPPTPFAPKTPATPVTPVPR
jgi:hypothetical protein